MDVSVFFVYILSYIVFGEGPYISLTEERSSKYICVLISSSFIGSSACFNQGLSHSFLDILKIFFRQAHSPQDFN